MSHNPVNRAPSAHKAHFSKIRKKAQINEKFEFSKKISRFGKQQQKKKHIEMRDTIISTIIFGVR